VLSETLSPSRTGDFIFYCGVQVSFGVSLLLDRIVCVCVCVCARVRARARVRASKYMVIEGLTLVKWYFTPAHIILLHLTKCSVVSYIWEVLGLFIGPEGTYPN